MDNLYDETCLRDLLNNSMRYILSGHYYNALKELAYAMGIAGFSLDDDLRKAVRLPNKEEIEQFFEEEK